MALDMDALVLVPMFRQFGEPLAYNPPDTTDEFAFVGIFDSELISPDDGADASGAFVPYRTLCKVREKAFPDPVGPQQSGAIRRGDTEYVITDVRPDGRGLILLALARA